MHVKRVTAVCALFVLTCVAGCGDGKGMVTGTVTLDARPIRNGMITFVSIDDGPLIREGAVITDSAFKTRVPPGKYRVELSAQEPKGSRKQTGFDGKEEVIVIQEEIFPEHYNTHSELTEVITPGENVLNLNLKSNR